MKKKEISKLKFLILITFQNVLLILPNFISAQGCSFYSVPAQVGERYIGPANTLLGSVQNTGNDSRNSVYNAGYEMTVHVWDG